MEPRIQYAKTKDGVSIAFWTLGEGPTMPKHSERHRLAPSCMFLCDSFGNQVQPWRCALESMHLGESGQWRRATG